MFPSFSQRPNGELGFRFLQKKKKRGGEVVKHLSFFYFIFNFWWITGTECRFLDFCVYFIMC